MVRREPPTRGGGLRGARRPLPGVFAFCESLLHVQKPLKPPQPPEPPLNLRELRKLRFVQIAGEVGEVTPLNRPPGRSIASTLSVLRGRSGRFWEVLSNLIEGVRGNVAPSKPGQCALRATLRAGDVLAAEAARGRSWARSRAGIFMAITLQQPRPSPRFSPGLRCARPNASPCAARRRPRRCCCGRRRPTRRRGHRGSSGRRRSLA